MLKRIFSGMVLALLMIGVLALAFNIQPANAVGTIYIRADGSVEGTDKIISSDNFTYKFTDNIYDEIVVERDNIVIDGSGYTLQGTGFFLSAGIDISGRRQLKIQNVEIRNFGYGIVLEDSSNNTILGNNITNNTQGIRLSHGSSNNTIAGNNITANNNVGVWLYSFNLTISGNNNTICGNNITNNEYGITLERSFDNTISGNKIANNWYGIYLDESSSNTFSGNNITANLGYGILLDSSSNNTIFENNITVYNVDGVKLYGSSNNTIYTNNITSNNYNGILLSYSSNNSISGNNITNNIESGIRLFGSSNYNRINGNNITDNSYGIFLQDRLSSNNLIYNNNFKNTKQVYVFFSGECPANTWDNGYPSGGNYWSDYAGEDANGDGIGDTPYIIDANNTDRYPLMALISLFDAGVWNDIAYNVDVVSNSTVSGFYFNPDEGSFLRFNVTGEDGTTGFCRVTIPKGLLWVEDGWTITVGAQPVTNYTIIPNQNYTYLYFSYNHSTQTVIIQGTHVIPEFPSTMVLALFTLTTLIATTILKKKRKTKTQIP